VNPSLSPDGSTVAFAWEGDKQDNFDIYVAAVPMHSDEWLRVTSSPADEFSPAWSPDGQKIAFVRQLEGNRSELLVVPAKGGPEHKLAGLTNREIRLRRLVSLSWSADAQWIIASHREPGDNGESIYAFSLTGGRRRLTTPPKEYDGDYMPALSPDGSALAFCRLAGFSTSEIYWIALGHNWRPEGAPRVVTADRRWSVNPVWVRDGSSLLYIFSEHPEARHQLRVINALESLSAPQIVSIPDEPREITAGAHLVYSRRIFDTNIWRVRIPDRGQPPAIPVRFISSTQADEKPSYSPDGRRIAFVSKRSGSDEIWIANRDGSNPTRMTHFGGPLVGAMNWAPDGQRLVFHARPEGQADLFVLPAAGGRPVRLTTHPADDFMPSYSRDGRWIYFASRRSGENAIWKIPSSGGEAIQLAGGGGTKPVESMDGKLVYYNVWPAPDAILSVPSGGGQPVKVIGPTHPFPMAFAVTAEGIYYPAPPHSGDDRYIRFFQFSTRESHPVATVNRPFRLGMSVSPDGRFLTFDQVDESGSDLMLVQDFKLP
jgi:Tol biopolymer transport system component